MTRPVIQSQNDYLDKLAAEAQAARNAAKVLEFIQSYAYAIIVLVYEFSVYFSS